MCPEAFFIVIRRGWSCRQLEPEQVSSMLSGLKEKGTTTDHADDTDPCSITPDHVMFSQSRGLYRVGFNLCELSSIPCVRCCISHSMTKIFFYPPDSIGEVWG